METYEFIKMKKIKTIFLFIIIIIISMSIGILLGFKFSKTVVSGNSMFYQFEAEDYYSKGDHIGAIAFNNRAIAVDPEDFWPHYGLADMYYTIGRYDLALEEYEVALDLTKTPDDVTWRKRIKEKIKKTKEILSKDDDNETDKSRSRQEKIDNE
jgi:tetratricopeptide (TPR) repeat protein